MLASTSSPPGSAVRDATLAAAIAGLGAKTFASAVIRRPPHGQVRQMRSRLPVREDEAACAANLPSVVRSIRWRAPAHGWWIPDPPCPGRRSEEHTSELQSLMRISYAVFFLKNKIN